MFSHFFICLHFNACCNVLGGKTITGHFTVVCAVIWPMDANKAGGDLVLIQTSVLFLFILMQTTLVCVIKR